MCPRGRTSRSHAGPATAQRTIEATPRAPADQSDARDAQERVLGSPLTAGAAENVQLDAFVTIIVRTTVPPERGKLEGLAANDVIKGGEGA